MCWGGGDVSYQLIYAARLKFQCLRDKKHGALESFEASMVDKNGWASMYKGNGTVGEIDRADYVK